MIDIVCLPVRKDDKTFIRFCKDTLPYCAVFFDGYDQGVVYGMCATETKMLILRETGKLVPASLKDDLINIVTKGGRLGYN